MKESVITPLVGAAPPVRLQLFGPVELVVVFDRPLLLALSKVPVSPEAVNGNFVVVSDDGLVILLTCRTAHCGGMLTVIGGTKSFSSEVTEFEERDRTLIAAKPL